MFCHAHSLLLYHQPSVCVPRARLCMCVWHMWDALLSDSFPPLQCSLLRRLRNVITDHTWRASWRSHKVRMKYETDYGDLRLYYHDFLIIASLIYFCLLSPSLSLFRFLFPRQILRPWLAQKWNKKVSLWKGVRPRSHVHAHTLRIWGWVSLSWCRRLKHFVPHGRMTSLSKSRQAILRQLDLTI